MRSGHFGTKAAWKRIKRVLLCLLSILPALILKTDGRNLPPQTSFQSTINPDLEPQSSSSRTTFTKERINICKDQIHHKLNSQNTRKLQSQRKLSPLGIQTI